MPLDSPLQLKRVVLTGALGDIGRRIASDLGKEFPLTRTDLRATPEQADVIAADLTDFSQVDRLLEGADAVVHLAVAPGKDLRESDVPGQVDPVDEQMLRVNTTSIFNVLEAARRHGIKRVVYASSLTILLGDKHRDRYDSQTPLQPTNLYACTKHFGEQLAGAAWRNHGLSSISLRIGQPSPVGHAYDDLWRANKRARSWFVPITDIIRGIACALKTATPYGVYNLVSASDNPRVDWKETEAGIGYTPQAYYSDNGLSFHERGELPAQDGSILTHNPGE